MNTTHRIENGLHVVRDEHFDIVRTIDQKSSIKTFPEVSADHWLQLNPDGSYSRSHQKRLAFGSQYYISYENNVEVQRKKENFTERISSNKINSFIYPLHIDFNRKCKSSCPCKYN